MERIIRAARVLGINIPRGAGRTIRYMFAWMVFAATTFFPAGPAMAASLTNASVALADPRPSQTSVNYTFTSSGVTLSSIRCIKLVFATTATGSTVPTNMDTSVGAVALNAGATNFVPTPGSWSLDKSTNGTLLLTLAGGETPASSSGRTVSFDGITNSSIADTGYYLRFNTYDNTNCATTPRDDVTVQFINTNSSQLSLTVDNSLSFSVSGVNSSLSCNGTTTTGTSTATTLPFGSVTPGANRVVCQDLLAATNATHGYSIYVRYTGAPQSGTDTIDDHTGSNASPTAFSAPGTEAYGYTTDDATLGAGTADRFTNPSQGWAAATTSNAEIGYESASVSTTTYRIGHQVGISVTTPGGIYQTTIIYTCVPVY